MANGRRSLSKRRRFDIFRRDHFTCQYCGSQPPDVVLVVDHVVPVVEGGQDTDDNLVTSCEDCNQGKGARRLDNTPIRPDADLLFLEAQQELVEIRRYQLLLSAKEKALDELIGSIQDRFIEITGRTWYPDASLVRNIITKYSPEIAGEAVIILAHAVNERRIGYWDKWQPYLWGIARNLAVEQED